MLRTTCTTYCNGKILKLLLYLDIDISIHLNLKYSFSLGLPWPVSIFVSMSMWSIKIPSTRIWRISFFVLITAILAASASAGGNIKSGIQNAIKSGDLYTLQNLLASDTVSASDLADSFCAGGLTPLQFAANTNGASVSALLDAGCDPRLAHSGTHTTPLMFAARSGEEAAVKDLLAVLSVEEINDTDEHQSTALHLCALSCNAKVARLLLNAGVRVLQEDGNGNTALHVGAFYCSTEKSSREFASALLAYYPTANDSTSARSSDSAGGDDSSGASEEVEDTTWNIDKMSKFGRTALMLAAKRGNTAYFNTLLAAGANAELVSPYDQKTVEDFKKEFIITQQQQKEL